MVFLKLLLHNKEDSFIEILWVLYQSYWISTAPEYSIADAINKITNENKSIAY
jgi:hypothetical protein